MIEICYGMNCPHELNSGECGKHRDDVCPDSYETEKEYQEAEQAAQDRADDYGDYLYELEKDRRLG